MSLKDDAVSCPAVSSSTPSSVASSEKSRRGLNAADDVSIFHVTASLLAHTSLKCTGPFVPPTTSTTSAPSVPAA